MKELVTPSEAFQKISEVFPKAGDEIVSLHLSAGRMLAEDIFQIEINRRFTEL